jgi:hypothetical protein
MKIKPSLDDQLSRVSRDLNLELRLLIHQVESLDSKTAIRIYVQSISTIKTILSDSGVA